MHTTTKTANRSVFPLRFP